MLRLSLLLAVLCACSQALYSHPVRYSCNAGIHLAVEPRCGRLCGLTPADVNAGLNPEQFKTIVSFGVRIYFNTFCIFADAFHRIALQTVEKMMGLHWTRLS